MVAKRIAKDTYDVNKTDTKLDKNYDTIQPWWNQGFEGCLRNLIQPQREVLDWKVVIRVAARNLHLRPEPQHAINPLPVGQKF
jgi:hypothetical protein